MSGLYFYGSGVRRAMNWGIDLREIGDRRPNELRLRPDGTIVPRNNFVGQPLHRVDMRVMRKFRLPGGGSVDRFVEVFNVFNRANWRLYYDRQFPELWAAVTVRQNCV